MQVQTDIENDDEFLGTSGGGSGSGEPLAVSLEGQDESAFLSGSTTGEPAARAPAPQTLEPAGMEMGEPEPEPGAIGAADIASLLSGLDSQSPAPPPQTPQVAQRPLPPPPPGGLTDILPQDFPVVLDTLGQAFPSLNPLGVVLDFTDRMNYAVAVIDNHDIKSEVRAQMVEQFMSDGKLVPEALPRQWYESVGILLQPRPQSGMALPPMPGGRV